MRKIVEASLSGNITKGQNYTADVGTKVFPDKGRDMVEVKKGTKITVKEVKNGTVFFGVGKKDCNYDLEDFRREFMISI